MVERVPEAVPAERARPHVLEWLPGAFMLLFVAAGLVLTLFNPAARRSPGDQPILSGAWTAAYSAAYDQALPIRQTAVDTWGVIGYALFKEGRRGVLVGTDDWLYTTEEFETYPDEAARVAARLELIREVAATLEASGSRLMVALVPAKARIYPEHLGRYALPSAAAPRHDALQAELEEAGILAPDLSAALLAAKPEEAVFFRTDTHWTPFGAQVAAQVLTAAVLAEGLELPPERFETQVNGMETVSGDLLSFIPLGRFSSFGPEPDTFARTETLQLTGKDVGLFDEIEIPVALVGTSYSADARWNFGGALKTALQADVLNVAQQGRGPFAPMLEYLDSERFAATPPRLVVWEIPERYVPMDDAAISGALEGKSGK